MRLLFGFTPCCGGWGFGHVLGGWRVAVAKLARWLLRLAATRLPPRLPLPSCRRSWGRCLCATFSWVILSGSFRVSSWVVALLPLARSRGDERSMRAPRWVCDFVGGTFGGTLPTFTRGWPFLWNRSSSVSRLDGGSLFSVGGLEGDAFLRGKLARGHRSPESDSSWVN